MCGISFYLFQMHFLLLLHRKENLTISLILLIGCYLVVLLPARFPLKKAANISHDYQHSKDLVKMPDIKAL